MGLRFRGDDGTTMNFEEHVAKSLILAPAGVPVPRGILCITVAEAAMAAANIGPCVI
jgi:succinyl-CoA synthetase beta subunit